MHQLIKLIFAHSDFRHLVLDVFCDELKYRELMSLNTVWQADSKKLKIWINKETLSMEHYWSSENMLCGRL